MNLFDLFFLALLIIVVLVVLVVIVEVSRMPTADEKEGDILVHGKWKKHHFGRRY